MAVDSHAALCDIKAGDIDVGVSIAARVWGALQGALRASSSASDCGRSVASEKK